MPQLYKTGINAITATELFRSYPPLASALLALMKEETEVEAKNTVHPVLFPLLLLLSRLQPISSSRIDPNADDISQAFIIPVMNCLCHVHHKVRLVAARALAVLCVGDDCKVINNNSSSRAILIEKCIALLSSSCSFVAINHNQDHGALLAIKCLLQHCTMPFNYATQELQQALFYFASWGYYKG